MDTENPEAEVEHDEEYRRAQRKAFDEGITAAVESFDKAILTLTAAALGLSIAVVRDVAGNEPQGLGWLITSWVFLVSALASSLGSQLSSMTAHRRRIAQLDRLEFGKVVTGFRGKIVEHGTDLLNWFTFIAFIAGIAFWAVFAATNIR